MVGGKLGTMPETLSAYLPYDIDVKTPDYVGQLSGVLKNRLSGCFIAQVTIGETWNGYSLVDVLPVLYPFSVLGNQANCFRTDAAAHATMMELATALQGGPVTEIVEANYVEANDRSLVWLQYENEEGDYCDAYLWSDGAAEDANDEAVQMIDFLRKRHIAVGLTSEQYIRKEVARA